MNNERREQRRRRIRARVRGTAERPRVSVFRSNRLVSVQLIDDEQGRTLLAVAGAAGAADSKTAQAEQVGRLAAEQAQAAGITKVVFDRAGYRYHGRVKAVAEGLRAGGLQV